MMMMNFYNYSLILMVWNKKIDNIIYKLKNITQSDIWGEKNPKKLCTTWK